MNEDSLTSQANNVKPKKWTGFLSVAEAASVLDSIGKTGVGILTNNPYTSELMEALITFSGRSKTSLKLESDNFAEKILDESKNSPKDREARIRELTSGGFKLRSEAEKTINEQDAKSSSGLQGTDVTPSRKGSVLRNLPSYNLDPSKITKWENVFPDPHLRAMEIDRALSVIEQAGPIIITARKAINGSDPDLLNDLDRLTIALDKRMGSVQRHIQTTDQKSWQR